jgi:ferredoxin
MASASMLMSESSAKDLTSYLAQFTENDWLDAIGSMLTCIHEVDRNAVQIWFRFYPLTLQQKWAAADDREEFIRGLALQGVFELKDHIDTSHHFLYGHRYWRSVKAAVLAENEMFKDDGQGLSDVIKLIAMRVAERTGVDRPLVNAISAVGLMTLNQVGIEAFSATPGDMTVESPLTTSSPDAILAERAKDDSQGLFGFLKTVDKKFSVRYLNERRHGRFAIVNDQEIASASARDQSHDWKSEDPRCWEGVVPVECVSASCGTCWVGVLGGQEKLSEVKDRERRAMKVFGYKQPEDAHPYLRLACQARAAGNVTIVIPPWNGVFGKKVYGNVEDLELEPVTTSAKALREAISSAASNE